MYNLFILFITRYELFFLLTVMEYNFMNKLIGNVVKKNTIKRIFIKKNVNKCKNVYNNIYCEVKINMLVY